MDMDTLSQAVEHASLLALGVAFIAGLVFSFNPVALASIPVSLAYVTRARSAQQSALFAVAFTAAMILAQVALGFVAGLGGSWAVHLIGRQWGLLLGPVLIVLGLMWPGWVRLRLPSFAPRAKRPKTAWGAFALGIVFAVAVCPVCTPALVILLGAAAAIASPFFGAALLLAFSVGRAIPIALGAWAAGWLENLSVLSNYHKSFEIAGAVTLIASGLYMLNAYYFWIPSLAM
ncbi:cytochrome c biogenesis protein CcdA [Bradyrhizobium sp. ISRA443]|uniref:cytochrome c biogenesis CcdA family protein n=1 Tax=unclassified Bradyrhizobium TaxID=2631580 RepID=UPI00247A5C0E|nr:MULTISPECIES: cytochrome c biogenesis protein CcdA [unclassified Bradyrhizobium]WGR91986.1 cytochrome c biogenesis protein CcdA [Bradyrhizobium sp. ISRA435]WGS02402.1 cytochrome c biogenesis protein CcdA [Bradyrhizobium sp. ISRA436]WGS09287.1 cytochrome c biogenesis protein CcdA [Bradyrhizobium sp. ISRA437]WGS16176.1 cytochrome c biogenesis protein CcdA [Bradyrhizobium sp. ISRA443]